MIGTEPCSTLVLLLQITLHVNDLFLGRPTYHICRALPMFVPNRVCDRAPFADPARSTYRRVTSRANLPRFGAMAAATAMAATAPADSQTNGMHYSIKRRHATPHRKPKLHILTLNGIHTRTFIFNNMRDARYTHTHTPISGLHHVCLNRGQ